MPRGSLSPSPPPSHRRSRSRRRRSPSPLRSQSRSRSRSRARTSTKHSSSARSKSSDSDKKGSVLKTSLVFLGAVGAATYAAHKFWPKGVIHGDREDWEVAQEVKHVHKRRARSRDDAHRGEKVETFRREERRWVEDEEDRDIPGRITGGRGPGMRRDEDGYRREPGVVVERRRERWEDDGEYDRRSTQRSSNYVEDEWSAPRPRLDARRDERVYVSERPRQIEYDHAYVQDRSSGRRSSVDWERDSSRRW